MLHKLIAWMSALSLLIAPVAAAPATAAEAKVKYAKTEVEKAKGKCVGAVFGGALLGALIGRATGRRNTGAGIGIGALAGGAACAAIMANARHKDRIIAAQLAAARFGGRPYATTFHDDTDNSDTYFKGVSGPSEQIDAARLQPVRYESVDGQKLASPVLATGGQDCRAVSSSLSNGQGAVGQLPTQIVCRTPNGDYQPYALRST